MSTVHYYCMVCDEYMYTAEIDDGQDREFDSSSCHTECCENEYGPKESFQAGLLSSLRVDSPSLRVDSILSAVGDMYSHFAHINFQWFATTYREPYEPFTFMTAFLVLLAITVISASAFFVFRKIDRLKSRIAELERDLAHSQEVIDAGDDLIKTLKRGNKLATERIGLLEQRIKENETHLEQAIQNTEATEKRGYEISAWAWMLLVKYEAKRAEVFLERMTPPEVREAAVREYKKMQEQSIAAIASFGQPEEKKYKQ